MDKATDNIHLQAFNRTVKDLIDLKELYLSTRLSGEPYSNEEFDTALREVQLEVRSATLALLHALGLKYEWTALQRGISELEHEAEQFNDNEIIARMQSEGGWLR